MATEAKPETTPETTPGTAVTAPPPDGVKLRDLKLTPEQEMAIYERQQQSRTIAQIKGATWSKEVDANAIRAIAIWARENDVEPVTEINVLGGNIYINARYYERKLGELIALGLVTGFHKDWVHTDDRLRALAAAGDARAIAEEGRRAWERIQHGLSDLADFACVFYVHFRGLGEPAIGAKEHIPGKKKTIRPRNGGAPFQVDADPIGDQSPMETVETRALRRAMLKLRAAFPPGFRMASTKEDDSVEMAEVVRIGHEKAKQEREIERALGHKPLASLNAGDAADPYGVKQQPQPEKVVAPLTPPAAEPWDIEESIETDEDIRRQEREMLAREEQGGLGLGDTKPASRNAVSEGR